MLTTLRKYFRLWFSFLKASFIADLEYRANFVIRLATDIFWYIAQVMVFEALYKHTDKIGSWTLEQTRVFLGILFIADGLYMIFFHDNLEKMNERARKGELDLLLAKPVNSQFMLSTQRVGTVLLGNLCVGTSYFIWALHQYQDFQAARLLWLLILIPTGLTCLYTIRFMISATTLIFTRADNLQYIWYQIYRLGLRPDSIYSPWLKFVILTILPVGLIASVPSRALLGEANPGLYLYTIFLSATLLYGSHRFWNYCLSKYTSASS